ncbi:MAG: hypothetical protein H3C58_15560, partial [Fimbriimonadaceae bacterium]|nr:hypothetical protein [Fimbriimonadaceae bacterium]
MVLEFLTWLYLVGKARLDPVKALLEFAAVAVTAGGAHIPEPPTQETDPRLATSLRGDLVVTANGHSAHIDPSVGRIRAYFTGGYTSDYNRQRSLADVKPRLTRDRVVDLCNLYIKAAWPGCDGLKFRKIGVDDRNIVVVDAVFVEEGLPHSMFPVVMELDQLYGRLLQFMCVYPASPPNDLVPKLSLAEARTQAFDSIAFCHNSTIMSKVEELELAIVEPEALTKGRQDWFSSDQLNLGASRKGILAYSGLYEDREVVREDGVGWHRYRVVIDAQTGRVLALWHFRPVSGTSRNYDPPFGWNLGPGALRFTLNGREVSVQGEVERVAAPAKF